MRFSEKEADKTLYNICKKFDLLTLICPTNLQNEKEKFFAQKNYNPQFTYSIQQKTLDKLESEIQNMYIEKTTWRFFLLEEVREKLLLEIGLLRSVGVDLQEFLQINETIFFDSYDLSDESILEMSEGDLNVSVSFNSEELLSVEEIRAKFDEFLQKRKINWKVLVSDEIIPLIYVKNRERTIVLKQNLELSEFQVKRLIAHEIETHVYRSLNGKNLFQMASLGLKNYEKTEEGLAAYNESLIYPRNKDFLERFIWRYRAILFANKHSFCDLFEYLSKNCKMASEDVWNLAVRTKRGINDTSQKGAFLKDRIYLQGYYLVKDVQEEDRRNLYKGKFSLEHLQSEMFDLSDDSVVDAPDFFPTS